jgi:hypothetical protein
VRHRIIAGLAIALSVTGLALAQSLPSHYPDRFERTGTINDAYEQTIVVNDVAFELSPEVVVHSYQYESNAPVATLVPGTKIGYRIDEDRLVSEIWLLPAYYDETRRR